MFSIFSLSIATLQNLKSMHYEHSKYDAKTLKNTIESARIVFASAGRLHKVKGLVFKFD